jgi:hypothetical protein
MFNRWKPNARLPRIRTRYLTPVLLTPAAAEDGTSHESLRGFLLELASDRVSLVLGEAVAPDARYVLRIAGEEGVSEEPACTVLACRRDDSDGHVIAQLRFDDYRVIRPAVAAA